MRLIAWSCVTLLGISARLRVPSSADYRVAKIAAHIVMIYRRALSQHTGRTCLFRKTCSHATLDYLNDFGWNKGIVMAYERVRSCGGAYTMTVDVFGRPVLIVLDGTTFGHNELSEHIVCKHLPHRAQHQRQAG